mgnify:CR=1 FL=1
MEAINKEIALCQQCLIAWDMFTAQEERETIYRLNMLNKIKQELSRGAINTSSNR